MKLNTIKLTLIILIGAFTISSCASIPKVAGRINTSDKNYYSINKAMKNKKGLIVLNDTYQLDPVRHRQFEVEELIYINSSSDSLFYKVFNSSKISGKHVSEIHKIGIEKKRHLTKNAKNSLLFGVSALAVGLALRNDRDEPYHELAVAYTLFAGIIIVPSIIAAAIFINIPSSSITTANAENYIFYIIE